MSSADSGKPLTLSALGWQTFFGDQTTAVTLKETPPVRVVEVHRTGLRVMGETFEGELPPRYDATVGDWLLLDGEAPEKSLVLTRSSLFKRFAPGIEKKLQLIAANVDTAFIVSSCNLDFNVARLERYVALAFDAGVTPVIVLTKADLCADPAPLVAEAKTISKRVRVLLLNALSETPQHQLAPWCDAGQTIAFLGSSGVGKSTLVNALFGTKAAVTGAARADDDRGRHTTTHRQLHFLPSGCAVLDTPGMRELQLADSQNGIAEVFADVITLTEQCRFRDCSHETEPGCAVQAALKTGELDQARLVRWSKLVDEERLNSTLLAEGAAGDKSRRTSRLARRRTRK